MSPLRVALLGSAPPELVSGLREAGHRVEVVRPSLAAIDALLERRGFTVPLATAGPTTAALLRGRFDVAHSFSPAEQAAARAWRRAGGGPIVHTWLEPVGRESLADRRLRLALVRGAAERSDAVLAADEAVRASLERWLAVDAPVLTPRDAAGYARVYGDLIARRYR